MSLQDPVSDMLTRIRNAQMRKKKDVTMPSSKLKLAIAEVLQQEGYIVDYSSATEGAKANMTVVLKYFEGRPVIETLQRESKPSRRVYRSATDMPKIKNGLGTAIVSTSNGVMTDRAARAAGKGGEILCIVT